MTVWIFGAIMGALSLLGLTAAAWAQDGMFHATGLLFFLFGLAMIFGLIHKHTGTSTG
ncbi:hypothetical protein SH611_11500 [Geminicoccaceae bacterium 1502E]|nr:hypothetical protein [Geminicoccaceae bacterium 1502E]